MNNGSKKEEGDYERGIQNGHWTFWHENGELKDYFKQAGITS